MSTTQAHLAAFEALKQGRIERLLSPGILEGLQLSDALLVSILAAQKGIEAAMAAQVPAAALPPTRPVLASGWTVTSTTSASPTAFYAARADGLPVSIAPSMLGVYRNAPLVWLTGANRGLETSIASVSAASASTMAPTLITLADTIRPPATGDSFVVYARPVSTDSTGAGTVNNTQVYGPNPNVPSTAVTIPANSTAAVSTPHLAFRSPGQFTEHHRGVVKATSANGYAYTITAQLFAQFTNNGTPVATTDALSTVAASEGFQAFAVYPPSFANSIVFTLTPSQAGASEDTVTLVWVIDGNDVAVDQDPTGAYPVYVGGLDPSGAIKTAQVDANGNWYVTPTSGTAPVEQGTLTDRSGAVTTGGTSQQLAAANTSRRYLLVENPSTAAGQGIATAESLFVNFTSDATTGEPSIELTPGGSLTLDAGFVSTEAVTVVAATTGHKWAAKEG